MRSRRTVVAGGGKVLGALPLEVLGIGVLLIALLSASTGFLLGHQTRSPEGQVIAAGGARRSAGAGKGGTAGGTESQGGATDPLTGAPTGGPTASGGSPVGGVASGGPGSGGGTGANNSGVGGFAGGAATGLPGGTGSAGGTAIPKASLTASDRGVTADTVKLGFLVANTNNLSGAGFNVGLAGDQTKIINAWAKAYNDHGGINGRKIITDVASFDVLDVNDMQAQCKKLTVDDKVFAVITTGGYDSVAQLCVAQENKTPLISTDPEPAEWHRQAAPYLWSTFMDKDRVHRNHARWMKESGYVRQGTVPCTDPQQANCQDRLGLMYHDIPNVAPPVEHSLIPELKRQGIAPLVTSKLVTDSNQALSEINSVVLQMKQAGVTFVVFPVNLIYKTQFMQVAEKQNYFPRYTDSDSYFGCEDFVTATYPTKSWDHTKCLTSTASGLRADQFKSTPFSQYADKVYKDAYPQGYATEGTDPKKQQAQQALNYSLGSEIVLWAQASTRAGAKLTRAGWGAEMGKTGNFADQVLFGNQFFAPGHEDGADKLAVVQFHAEASDGFDAAKFHLVQPGFFNNYY
ncbi:MAG: hypothetical protein NVS3B21_30900 [Acidimicrobiales bacterium]